MAYSNDQASVLVAETGLLSMIKKTPLEQLETLTPTQRLIQQWRERGAIRAIDHYWIEALASQAGEAQAAVILAGVLCSAYLGKGHVCLSLSAVLSSPGLEVASTVVQQEELHLWQAVLQANGVFSLAEWQACLLSSPLVSQADQASATTPMVLQQDRLYLARYYHYEEAIYHYLKHAAAAPLFAIEKRWLDDLFPDSREPQADIDWQKVAVASAAMQTFAVISGGPGTGKTTTVTKLLALLVQQAQAQGQTLNIKLTAPTGKAAARLTESISRAKQSLTLDESIKAAIPERASTLHRLLGANFGRSEFKHNKQNPLHLDVLLVDEVSMVDLPMMAKLVDALPPHSRLILLGDKDQLASVEAGGVLADMTAGLESIEFLPNWSQKLAQLVDTRLQKYANPQAEWLRCHLTLLTKSYRFDDLSGIGQLAQAVNQGKGTLALKRLLQPTDQSVQWHRTEEDTALNISELAQGYESYWKAVRQSSTAEEVFQLFSRYQVLCAIRQGEMGVETVNAALEKYFYQRGFMLDTQAWYAGKAIMITRNDASLNLFNGDIGLCLPDPQQPERLRVWFQMSDASYRGVLPSRLGDYESVYAMTVHKSQGSEFEQVVLIMPASPNPVVTKELLYTGITRAKKSFALWGNELSLKAALRTRVIRFSGLQTKLWQ